MYTLYRSSPIAPDIRVHVATFDAHSFDDPSGNKRYNFDICSDAQVNFNERNRDAQVRLWCEEGRFRESLPR